MKIYMKINMANIDILTKIYEGEYTTELNL